MPRSPCPVCWGTGVHSSAGRQLPPAESPEPPEPSSRGVTAVLPGPDPRTWPPGGGSPQPPRLRGLPCTAPLRDTLRVPSLLHRAREAVPRARPLGQRDPPLTPATAGSACDSAGARSLASAHAPNAAGADRWCACAARAEVLEAVAVARLLFIDTLKRRSLLPQQPDAHRGPDSLGQRFGALTAWSASLSNMSAFPGSPTNTGVPRCHPPSCPSKVWS